MLAAQEEIAGAIALGHSEGFVEKADRDRLLGALELGQRQVEEVMMHRRDIEMIDAEAAPAEILSQAINSPHTRIPIFRGEPENIVGVIHAKDLSRAVHRFVQRAPRRRRARGLRHHGRGDGALLRAREHDRSTSSSASSCGAAPTSRWSSTSTARCRAW